MSTSANPNGDHQQSQAQQSAEKHQSSILKERRFKLSRHVLSPLAKVLSNTATCVGLVTVAGEPWRPREAVRAAKTALQAKTNQVRRGAPLPVMSDVELGVHV